MATDIKARLLVFCSWICYYYKLYVTPVTRRFWLTLWTSETTAVRLWFGTASIFFAIFIFESPIFISYEAEYHLMVQLSPYWIDARAFWGILFIINGSALIYGVLFRAYSTKLLILEGLLGVALWGSSAVAVYHTQDSLGAHTIAAIIALWILARYPTHAEYVAYCNEEDSEIAEAIHILSGEDSNDS